MKYIKSLNGKAVISYKSEIVHELTNPFYSRISEYLYTVRNKLKRNFNDLKVNGEKFPFTVKNLGMRLNNIFYNSKIEVIKKMTRYQCEVCGGEGYPLKPGYKNNDQSFSVLCPDHLMEFEYPKHNLGIVLAQS